MGVLRRLAGVVVTSSMLTFAVPGDAWAVAPEGIDLAHRTGVAMSPQMVGSYIVLVKPYGTLPSWFDRVAFEAEFLRSLPAGTRRAEDILSASAVSDLVDSHRAAAVHQALAVLDVVGLVLVELQPADQRVDVSWELYHFDGTEQAVARGNLSAMPAPPPPVAVVTPTFATSRSEAMPAPPSPPPTSIATPTLAPPRSAAKLAALPSRGLRGVAGRPWRWVGLGLGALGGAAILGTWAWYGDADITPEDWQTMRTVNTLGWVALGSGGASFTMGLTVPFGGQGK